MNVKANNMNCLTLKLLMINVMKLASEKRMYKKQKKKVQKSFHSYISAINHPNL